MKIVRVRSATEDITYGAAEEEGIRLYRGTPFVAWEPTEAIIPFDEADLLAPCLPTKVVAVAKNYVKHAEELDSAVPDEPLIFLKPSTSVIGPGATIRVPSQSRLVHHEAELAMVIGKVARHVAIEDVAGFVIGYTIANDVTARDLQHRDGFYTRAKGFDTFCPLGPAIETEWDPLEGQNITCSVNGELRQAGTLADMVYGPAEILSYVTSIMTLLPGDVVLTGTPAGVGPLEPGDVVECEIEGLGRLRNRVAA